MTTAPSESRGGKRSDTSAPADGVSALFRDLKLAIEYRPIGTLKAYATNPRSHPPEQLRLLSNSIRAFGLVMPVIIDENDILVGGHGVLVAAEQLGYAEVPVIRLKHLGETEKKVLRIALNRCAELGQWDKNLLKVEFESLLIDPNLSVDFDLSLSGFAMPEIYRITDEGPGQDDADDLTEEPNRREPPASRLGDTFLLEEHSITNGNACDAASYAALLGDERAAVGLHDAPYNVATRRISKSGRHSDFVFAYGELSEEAYTAFLTDFLGLARAHSRPGAVQFSFIDWRHMGEMCQAGRSAGLALANLCIWDKGSGSWGSPYRGQHELVFVFADGREPVLDNVQLGRFGRNRTNVWSWPGASSLRKELELHPTPKPVGLLAEAIRDVSNRGDIVLDCFSGSGSTIIAAAKTGRRARVIELDPHYVDVSVRRWEKWSGSVARHAATGLTFDQLKETRRAEAQTSDHATDGDHGPTLVRHRTRPIKPVEVTHE
jgi:DNA methylase/ParB-like nuclease domain